MKRHKYFKLSEMIYSETAKKLKISNNPSPEVKENLDDLMDFLDELREAWGSPIRVSSGYRSEKLNKAVGGSPSSSHMYGYGVDVVPGNGNIKAFKTFVSEWVENTKPDFDQIILEKSKLSEWVHIGLYNSKGEQRHKIFKLVVK